MAGVELSASWKARTYWALEAEARPRFRFRVLGFRVLLRIGLGGIVYYNYSKETQNSIGIC